MIAYVNGYVCTTPCEAAAARKGRDPFAPPDQTEKNDKTSGIDGQPAVIFSGVLANPNQIAAIAPTGAPSSSNQATLNILV